MGPVEAAGPAPAVEVLEQRDDGAAGRSQSLTRVARRERLGESGELAHRERRRRGQQHDVTRQSQDPTDALGSRELAGPEPGGVEVVLLGAP